MAISIKSGGSFSILSGGSAKVNVSAPAPFNPGSLPGLKAWYDASALTGLVDGNAIATWADGSGFGNTLTMTPLLGPGSQVSYLSADPLLNNLPVASFAGNAFMDLPFASGNTIPTGDSFTLFAVGYSAGSRGTYACMGGPGSFQQMLGFVPYDGTTYCNLNGNNAAFKAIPPNTPLILSYGYQSGTGCGDNLFYVNGSNAGVSQTGSSEIVSLNQGFRVGGRYATDTLPLIGSVAEVILYLGKQDNASRNLVTSYLASKYAIAI